MAPAAAQLRLGFCWIFALFLGRIISVQVTVPSEPVFGKVGSTVLLPCTYNTNFVKGCNLAWSFIPTGSSSEKEILYYDGELYPVDTRRNRIRLLHSAPTQGTASIEIQSIQPSDTGSYICRVVNPNDWSGNQQGTVNLEVLTPPSTPVCKMSGSTNVGSDVILTCNSVEGNPLPIYDWKKAKGVVPQANWIMDQRTGTLVLQNVSFAFTGSYQCTSSNEQGTASCSISVRITAASTAAVVAGAVVGTLLVLLLLGALAAYFVWFRKRHFKGSSSSGNELREDAVAPPFKNPKSKAKDDSESQLMNHSLGRQETASNNSAMMTHVV
ncbi:V-set and immunoglobulin domain-containing protein 2-like [Polypterus senegalus]|uniref:V-set and immunoglobulin domain-containing protein 2-like n=1 Tax=Polypterus senegalus TaxID=55291 RepID=UPI001965676E|nr:V-set and immunoglobulin domain-containing protein 2-like [Polypterus senegalus]